MSIEQLELFVANKRIAELEKAMITPQEAKAIFVCAYCAASEGQAFIPKELILKLKVVNPAEYKRFAAECSFTAVMREINAETEN